MALQVGIVGLPNVGKSTLFKALTRQPVDIQNYPFCTIEPNVGIVEVPDARLAQLAMLAGSRKVIPAVIEFVDIAGLVKGASQGEGLGNKFLQNIRSVDAIVEVVRVFAQPAITHVHQRIDPQADIEIVNTELVLADLETISRRRDKTVKEARAGKKEAAMEIAVLEKITAGLNQGALASDMIREYSEDEKKIIRDLHLLSAKPILYVYNVADLETSLGAALEERSHVKLDIKIEEELMAMPAAEAAELGLAPRLGELAVEAYALLGLMTYFTTGPEETRAWTIPLGSTAPQAGAAIHSDFEEHFIRAEVIYWAKLLAAGGWSAARDLGRLRVEGKDYVVQDGDVMVFKV